MSCRLTYSRHDLQRISDRKKRKLAIDDSNQISLKPGECPSTIFNSQIKMVEDSQSSLKGQRDLFGELIPYKPCSPVPSNKSVKKKTTSKKKKIRYEELLRVSPVKRPTRVFIPTPRIIKIMKDAQAELYSLMGLNKSSSDISVTSNESLNVSGVQNLLDSPIPKAKNECKTNLINNEIDEKSDPIFAGVIAFVDYKIDNERAIVGIAESLTNLGAKVEKTFNLKVSHVIFRDGYQKTFNTARNRNIPLVSALWIEKSRLANKILDPADYPPVGLEKYTRPKLVINELPKWKRNLEIIRKKGLDREQLFKSKCDKLMERINNFTKRLGIENENTNNCTSIEPPKKQKTIHKPDDQTNDIISILSDQLCKVLNTDDSQILNEDIDEMYVPMSIKILRKMLTPKEKENQTPAELNSVLTKIEDRLNLNSQTRQRLRKILFPSNEELLNMSVYSDFPSPSPQKNRISAPAKLITSKKQTTKLIKESSSLNKKLITTEKTPKKNVLQWGIPPDLRPKNNKIINVNKGKNVKINQTQDTISSELTRNSSMIFQTPKDSFASPVVVQTISCTGMTKCEVDVIKLSIQNLGTFTFQPKVEPSTTFLVTKSQPNRTLNMVFAMAFGCYIISEDWIHESYKIGRWLSHQQYLISEMSKPVKEFQTRRQTFGSLLTFHIFDNAGNIYISDTCDPSAKHLKRLVRACGGKCTSIEITADVVVGYTPRMINNINEKWILDCITQGTLLSTNKYTLTNSIINNPFL